MGFCKWDGCENYCEGSTDFCASHNYAIRKQAKEDAKPPKVVKAIPKMTEKMAKELATFEVKKAAHLKKHPDCQVKLIGGCTNRNNVVHHAGKRGKNLNNEETFMTACDYCHDQIEFVLSAKERREKGFLR